MGLCRLLRKFYGGWDLRSAESSLAEVEDIMQELGHAFKHKRWGRDLREVVCEN